MQSIEILDFVLVRNGSQSFVFPEGFVIFADGSEESNASYGGESSELFVLAVDRQIIVMQSRVAAIRNVEFRDAEGGGNGVYLRLADGDIVCCVIHHSVIDGEQVGIVSRPMRTRAKAEEEDDDW